MTQDKQTLTSVYRSFYNTYSAKYGPNTCIFLLVGKFYELYDFISETGQTSLKRAVDKMNIALKEKPGHGPNGETGLWAGFPEQSLHKFAQVLTRDGWTVVVVDQVKENDTVVDRVPVRILSPGTHVETATQDRTSVSALWLGKQMAASLIDPTTGEVISLETESHDDILHMFQVYGVVEVVVKVQGQGQGQYSESSIRSKFGIRGALHISPQEQNSFDTAFTREEYFRKLFRIKSLLPVRPHLSLPSPPSEPLEMALATLLRFVEDHFPQRTEHLIHLLHTPKDHMRLSNNILEQLNIITHTEQKSVLSLLEKTHSAIGKRALRERILRPTTNPEELELRWEQVSWASALEVQQRKTIERDLKGIYDIPRLHNKLASGIVSANDVLQMLQSYSHTICLIENITDSPLSLGPLESVIKAYRAKVLQVFDETKAQASTDGEPFGFLTDTAGPLTAAAEAYLRQAKESWEAKWTSICSAAGLQPSVFKVEKQTDYTLEGPRNTLAALKKVQGLEIEVKKSGPLIITCPAFTEYKNTLRAGLITLTGTLRQECLAICDDLWDSVKGIQAEWIKWIGRVDCSLSLAAAASEYKWVRPTIGDSLVVEGLRHPLIETAETREQYVKHDISLGGSKPRGWLIYGVNASGKSSLMKATGIAIILAQAGSFVPATTFSLRPYDAAFSRIWSQDNLWAGLSSFAVEVSELRDILTQATERSLVLGDEVCSGTESASATSLVASTLEYLDVKGAHFMFATHLHDLLKVPGFLNRPSIAVWHLRVFRSPEGKLLYDRTLQPGSGSATYGLEVARAMGLPFTVIERAHEIRRALGGEVAADEAPKSSWNSSITRKACEICKTGIVNDLEVHHIQPRAEGGSNELRNLIVVCKMCHDKHHAGELDIGPLQQTSDGLERSVTVTVVKEKAKARSADEIETIKAALLKYNGRPMTRICAALQEEGIRITPAQLKKLA